MEQKKYSIIYADPPWRYEMKKGQGVAENHYSTMGTEEICEKNCALFLWVTFPQLPEAFRVIKAWGFRYKTVAFVWIKLNRSGQGYFFGLGYWTRSNAEICLLATRGKPKRMGDLPRIELFARQRSPGWDAWGNEVDSSLDMDYRREQDETEKV